MENDNSSIDVTGREYLDILVRDQNGEEVSSWRPAKDQLFISDCPALLRNILASLDELSKIVSEWIALESLPRKGLGVNLSQKANEIKSSPVVNIAIG
jgi:hypothetical protein